MWIVLAISVTWFMASIYHFCRLLPFKTGGREDKWYDCVLLFPVMMLAHLIDIGRKFRK